MERHLSFLFIFQNRLLLFLDHLTTGYSVSADNNDIFTSLPLVFGLRGVTGKKVMLHKRWQYASVETFSSDSFLKLEVSCPANAAAFWIWQSHVNTLKLRSSLFLILFTNDTQAQAKKATVSSFVSVSRTHFVSLCCQCLFTLPSPLRQQCQSLVRLSRHISDWPLFVGLRPYTSPWLPGGNTKVSATRPC